MCHASKTAEDRARMNVEDQNVFMSRFRGEAWKRSVERRRPAQTVCNLTEATEGLSWEVDVRLCRLNMIVEENVEDVPFYSPLDEFAKARKGVLYDY